MGVEARPPTGREGGSSSGSGSCCGTGPCSKAPTISGVMGTGPPCLRWLRHASDPGPNPLDSRHSHPRASLDTGEGGMPALGDLIWVQTVPCNAQSAGFVLWSWQESCLHIQTPRGGAGPQISSQRCTVRTSPERVTLLFPEPLGEGENRQFSELVLFQMCRTT